MAVSRPVLLSLLAALMVAATVVAVGGARQSAAESTQPTIVTPAPEPVPARPRPARPRGQGTAGGEGTARGERTTPGRRAAPGTDAAPAGARAQNRTERRSVQERRQRRVADRRRPARTVRGVPPEVGRALAARRVVVLFFGQRGADDAATAGAVRSLEGIPGVSIFPDGIAKLAKYRRVTAGLGISQAPAVVVVDAKRRARLVEGYIDPGSLRQLVLDAR